MQNSVFRILKAALCLFELQGYSETGVRHIANRAGVGLGLVNHYFGEKRMLGMYAIALLWEHVYAWAGEHADPEGDPVFYEVLSTRALHHFLYDGSYRQLYKDALREDFFFDAITARYQGRLTVGRDPLLKKLSSAQGPDIALLYLKFLPYHLEKTLILKKEEGLFRSIPYADIPLHLSLTALQRFVPREDIIRFDLLARSAVAKYAAQLHREVSDEEIAEYIQSAALPAARHNTPE